MKSAELCLGMIAVGAVLAFGGVTNLAFSLMEVGVAVLAVFLLWRGEWPELTRPTIAVLAIILALPLLQLVPLSNGLLAVVSPMRLALQQQLLTPMGMPLGVTPITVNPYATQMGFLKLTCYALVFVLGFQISRQHSRSSFLAPTLVGIGVFEAVYGLIQYLTGWQYIFTYAKKYGTDVATGTYIDRNHFAGLLDMVLPFVLAGIMFRLPAQGGGHRPRWVHVVVSSPTTSHFLRDVVLFAIICVGLVFSRSRMGIAAAGLGSLLVVVIVFLRSKRRSVLAVAMAVLSLSGAYTLWIGLNPVIERFEALGRPGALQQSRLPIWRDSLALIGEFPLLGTGLGTYRWSSLHYQSSMLDTYYEHAHNDYLEFAADIGIPGTVVLFGSLWVLAAKVARRALVLERTKDGILAAGCAGAMVAMLTHEITEFNLQMPANALIFAWIAGTAAALVRKPLGGDQGNLQTAQA